MSKRFVRTTEGKFECLKCKAVYNNQSGLHVHWNKEHGAKKKRKKDKSTLRAAKKILKELGDEMPPLPKTAPVQRRIKFCPECGHEIPTGLMFD